MYQMMFESGVECGEARHWGTHPGGASELAFWCVLPLAVW